uniref:Uncharacterized protein n=1 Tax=uncultured Thiotrichaceae bacterium TaxID=298394 RepID=A0A6S6UDR4_9GAMM|nr:MAG: Unknown protein [uncultured Thiotrichaceae bacterium]
MQNFADYYSTMLAKQLFNESRKRDETIKDTHDPDHSEYHIPVQHEQEDLLDYGVFFNPGCGHQNAQEIKGRNKDFIRRWLTFYKADADALPHHHNLQQLDARRILNNREHAQLTAPLLVTLLVCVIMAAILSVGKSTALLLVPIGIYIVVWLKIKPEVNVSRERRKSNRTLRQQQTTLLADLTEQAGFNSPVERFEVFQQNYTLTMEDFLRSSLYDALPGVNESMIRDQLHSGDMQVFMLESRGVLQVPDVCQQSAERLVSLESLVRQTGNGWCALQPHAELKGLTRLHYVFCVIFVQDGVVLCNAYYDWVGDEMHVARSEYYDWQHITGVRLHEVHFPAENSLSEDLSDDVYQLHFGQPAQVLSVQIQNGDQQYCVLPLNQPLRQTLHTNLPNTLLVRHLKRDLKKLNSLLKKGVAGL